MTPHAADGPRAVDAAVGVSGPTRSPWLRILGTCLRFTGALLILLMAAAMVFAGVWGALSVLYAAVVVVLFFGISLLIGHFGGRDSDSGAIGLFLAAYILKVVGFAVVLFFLGTPQWLERTWFFAAAVAVVIVWQTAEIMAFSKARHLLYGPVPETQEKPDALEGGVAR